MFQQRQPQQQPSDSSWKQLETRSTSFPHTRPAAHHQESAARPWTSKFQNHFSQNTSTTGLPIYSVSPTDSPPPSRLRKKPPSKRTTPVLTLALLKLDENLGKFCQLLEDPTYENVQEACAILDSSVATAGAGNRSPHNHQDDFPPTSTPPTSDSPMSSPSLSPIASWFIGSYAAEPSPTSSAVALEGEWEKFSISLVIFAGLEGIYASLAHAESSDLAKNLTRLYEKMAVDIQLVRETLCDPFLPSLVPPPVLDPLHPDNVQQEPRAPPTTKNSRLSQYKEKAARLAMSLDIIRNICTCRCRLIEQQKILWSSPDSINTGDAATVIAQSILPLTNIPEYEFNTEFSIDKVHATGILRNVAQEAEAWCHLMEMASAIEQARFMPSLVNAQNVKVRLHPISKTCIHLWLLKLWQSLLSILPIVFDKVQSSTKSLYGFDKSSFDVPSVNRIGPSEDLNAKVGELLRMEEKTGVSFAVSVIYDASRSTANRFVSTTTFERGFTARDDVSSRLNAAATFESQNIFAGFPSLYMRSNLHMTPPRPSVTRRNSDKKEKESSVFLQEENSKKQVVSTQRPEFASWPYTSWPSLVPLLRSQARSTGRSAGEHWEWLQADSETSFHGTPINKNMWFVVLIGSIDDGKWNRRRSSTLIEEDVQFFLTEILSCLKFTEIFKRAHVLEIRRGGVESGSTFSTESGGKMLGGGHSDFVDLLQSFKEELGLRSPRTREALTTSYGLRLRSGRFGKSPGSLNRRAGSQPSHHAFFLGHQLMNAI